ncbi:GNAT family N-acetyltransferase [Streptomyces violaceochromogenes]|uniref:GNAT family N-acetyltransferase n=1 Tax=Streptomyces violaceochromogenes TaxID=67377 RepID=A0ABU6LZ37_9ACTN|nr:GNAT family N-acetyltransferase [Streptomyces violaceochromogenes]MEC7054785.1 GNAT family N-acetyltransferase [Streptomyces violaceochromogenes]GHC76526.1 acetyltransferase [Streptomyces violaceochromogenes]
MEQAVAECVSLLGAVTERDWEGVRAGRLEWDCRRTAVHIAEDLIAYAGQLAGREQDGYSPFELSMEEDTGNADVLRVIGTTGALLAAAIRTTPRDVRAFHPYPFRSANRDGFAAMGVVEVLLHTHDICEGLGLSYEPAPELCDFVLTRIFPHVQPGPTPWPTLLWATGRGEPAGRAPVTEWRWNNNLVIGTERLTLEGVTPAAAADLSTVGDGGFEWIEGGPVDGTRVGAGLVYKQYEDGIHRPEWGMYVLVRREDGRALGAMGFHGVPDETGRVEIGYDLVGGARGHGYATEALRTLSSWALKRDEVRTVVANVERGNLPSQNVLARAGFTQVAEDPGHLAYELREPGEG